MTDIFKGATSNSVFIELVDSTTGLPKTGIVHTDVTGSYVRTRSARVAITMATLASASAAYSSGGFILIDDTNQPGVYRIDVPDAAFVTGAVAVVVTVKATGCRTVSRLFSLVEINNQVAYAPNAVAGAANGLFIAGTNAATTVTSSFTTTFTGSLTGSVGSVSGAVGSVTGAVGSVTGNLGGNVNGNVVGSVASVSGNVSGSVGSVTGAVGSVTGSVGSVVGNVGGSTASVAGAVGSVTGNVGGDVAGKVLGGGAGTISGDGVRAASVTGAVGSVTGSVGSVVGAVVLDSAVGTQIDNIENASGYLLAVLAGACADPQTASETYAITVFGSTFTVDMAGQTSTGTRTAPTLTKA